MSYIERLQQPRLQEYLQHFPVVGITGPRQSGKSTMLQHLLTDYEYVTFDDYAVTSEFADDPEGFMARYNNCVIFDEAQKAPEIFNYVKIAVDNDRQNYGKYILTGSSQFAFVKGITESLAGRIGLMSLLPLSYQEMPADLRANSIYKGSYPELVVRHYAGNDLWMSSYLQNYITKDLRDLVSVGDLRDFSRFIELLAANASQVMNMSHYANDLGVTVQTIKRWLSALEAAYIVFLLPPFHDNLGKRIVKSPKMYFYDTGLVSYLTGVSTQEQYEKGPMYGALFENYVVSELKKLSLLEAKHNQLYFYRSSNGSVEVDVIYEHGQQREFIEIKASSTYTPRMSKHIKEIMADKDKGFILYQGKPRKISDNLLVQSYGDYLQQASEAISESG
ncbi:MAG: ATP-binding protein [Coxiellaceae bacterium]|nr:ATP-binding protein [Coxiellaceae bacterium]